MSCLYRRLQCSFNHLGSSSGLCLLRPFPLTIFPGLYYTRKFMFGRADLFIRFLLAIFLQMAVFVPKIFWKPSGASLNVYLWLEIFRNSTFYCLSSVKKYYYGAGTVWLLRISALVQRNYFCSSPWFDMVTYFDAVLQYCTQRVNGQARIHLEGFDKQFINTNGFIFIMENDVMLGYFPGVPCYL